MTLTIYIENYKKFIDSLIDVKIVQKCNSLVLNANMGRIRDKGRNPVVIFFTRLQRLPSYPFSSFSFSPWWVQPVK